MLRRSGQDDYALVCGNGKSGGCRRVFAAKVPRAEELPFEWTSSEGVQLPWTEYDLRTGQVLERVLRPDAMLVLPRERRRLFIESDVLVAFGDGNQAEAAVAKANRYDKFVGPSPTSEHSFYARRFTDGIAPELVILVSSTERAASVNAALAKWQSENRPTMKVVASTTAEMATRLTGAIPPRDPEPGRPPRAINTGEVDALKRFFNAVILSTKAARALARQQCAAVPEYPPESQRVSELLGRLLASSK